MYFDGNQIHSIFYQLIESKINEFEEKFFGL